MADWQAGRAVGMERKEIRRCRSSGQPWPVSALCAFPSQQQISTLRHVLLCIDWHEPLCFLTCCVNQTWMDGWMDGLTVQPTFDFLRAVAVWLIFFLSSSFLILLREAWICVGCAVHASSSVLFFLCGCLNGLAAAFL